MSKGGLSELNAVVAVATHRSFRGAATELGMSPSALSHAIASLEQRMGVRLFHRTTRSVALTDAGNAFLARVGPALKAISSAVDTAHASRPAPTGVLRIRAGHAAIHQIMRGVAGEFLRRCPDVELTLGVSLRAPDAAIAVPEGVPKDMVSLPCSRPFRFALVGSPAYFRRHALPRVPEDLRAHACLRRADGDPVEWKRSDASKAQALNGQAGPAGATAAPSFPFMGTAPWRFERRAEKVEIDVTGSICLDNDYSVREAALAGLGLAYLEDEFVFEDVAAGRLVRVLDDWSTVCSGLSLYFPCNKPVPPGLLVFSEIVAEDLRHPLDHREADEDRIA